MFYKMDKMTAIEYKFQVDLEDCVLKHHRKKKISGGNFSKVIFYRDGFKLQIKKYIN